MFLWTEKNTLRTRSYIKNCKTTFRTNAHSLMHYKSFLTSRKYFCWKKCFFNKTRHFNFTCFLNIQFLCPLKTSVNFRNFFKNHVNLEKETRKNQTICDLASKHGRVKYWLFIRNLRWKTPQFLWHNFNDFMEKELCIKFCGVVISFHEGMKLQSFESGMSDVIPTNIQNNLSLVFFTYFYYFYGKEPFTQFYGRFDHFLRTYVVKFWMIKFSWHNWRHTWE